MSQRALLTTGIAAMAASLFIAAAGVASGANVVPAGWFGSSSGAALSMDEARSSVQSFLDRSGNRDFKLDELMEFQQNFYALIKEKSTGVGAFELLVAKGGGAVAFEPGPNMMWNTKYGMMGRGGMMGGYVRSGSIGAMTVDARAAQQIAQSWLDRSFPGDSAGTADEFYGYYTFHFEKNGQVAGMLSVNGYSGQVWYHTWHGVFIQARDFGT